MNISIYNSQYKSFADIINHMSTYWNNIAHYKSICRHMNSYCKIWTKCRQRNHTSTYQTILCIINPYVGMWIHTPQYKPYVDLLNNIALYKSLCWLMESYCAIWSICQHMKPYCQLLTHMSTYEIMLRNTNDCRHMKLYSALSNHMSIY